MLNQTTKTVIHWCQFLIRMGYMSTSSHFWHRKAISKRDTEKIKQFQKKTNLDDLWNMVWNIQLNWKTKLKTSIFVFFINENYYWSACILMNTLQHGNYKLTPKLVCDHNNKWVKMMRCRHLKFYANLEMKVTMVHCVNNC